MQEVYYIERGGSNYFLIKMHQLSSGGSLELIDGEVKLFLNRETWLKDTASSLDTIVFGAVGCN